MKPNQRWTQFQVEAEIDAYGLKRIVDAHNKLVEVYEDIKAELSEIKLKALEKDNEN